MNFKDLPVRVSGAKRWAQRVEVVAGPARPFDREAAWRCVSPALDAPDLMTVSTL